MVQNRIKFSFRRGLHSEIHMVSHSIHSLGLSFVSRQLRMADISYVTFHAQIF